MARLAVEFRKTAPRAYAVRILRDDGAALEMNPAPGYDDAMPHDLLHLVVENELGLQQGVFGQVAAGGHAGTFRQGFSAANTREAKRARRRLDRRSARLQKEGRDEAAQSERATAHCLAEWRSRLVTRTRALRPPPVADAELTTQAMDRICVRLDELSARWRSLGVGESLTVDWSQP
jgi:hypothetical protein